MMNFKKIMGIICLISIIPYSVMASLRSDVQKILKNEFPVSYKFVQHKWFPDHKLLRFVSKKTGQRFMRKYLYIWKILKNKNNINRFMVFSLNILYLE